jgi:hypothetical protein
VRRRRFIAGGWKSTKGKYVGAFDLKGFMYRAWRCHQDGAWATGRCTIRLLSFSDGSSPTFLDTVPECFILKNYGKLESQSK